MRKTTTIATIVGLLVAALWVVAAMGARSGFGRPLRVLGIESMECNCSQVVSDGADATLWMFDAEPTINKVDDDGPSSGHLKKGDSIVAVDGKLITTVEGGRRFSRIRPGEAVVLTVRHGRRTRDETIVPRLVSDDTPLILGREHAVHADELRRLSEKMERLSRMTSERTKELQRRATLLSPRRDKLVLTLDELKRLTEQDVQNNLNQLPGLLEIPELPDLDLLDVDDTAPEGSFGFALSFSGRIKTGREHDPEWHFNELPEIQSVDPGSPAADAGLEPGDVLTHIDGVALDTDDGGRRFSEVRPGQRVTWTIRRDGDVRTVDATATERRTRARDTSRVRYSGSLGDTDIEVTGGRRVRVVEDGDVITIHTGDTVIHLRKSKKR